MVSVRGKRIRSDQLNEASVNQFPVAKKKIFTTKFKWECPKEYLFIFESRKGYEFV